MLGGMVGILYVVLQLNVSLLLILSRKVLPGYS